MRFRILGPLEVDADGRSLDLAGVRQRRLLATMLLNPNRVVALPLLIEAVWDDDPPATAARIIQNQVAELRKTLTRAGGLIDTDDAGYRLRVGPDELDAAVFARLTAQGEARRDPGLLRQALALWRGRALTGLGGRMLGREAARLDEQRLAAWEDCLELELAAGVHDTTMAELSGLVAQHPLRERLTGLWITALYRCGRRDEALAAYRTLADRLSDELGIDPSPRLRRLHEAVLGGHEVPLTADRTDAAVVPAQLPHDVAGFVGCIDDLAVLDGMLSDGQAGRVAVISTIAGTAGVGKTALALHWAHRVRDKFSDGQLYVNLRGFDPAGSAKEPAQAVRGFLDALHVPAAQIPADPDGQAALFRHLLADKRVLLVLDNARDAAQVRPLLPDAPGCLVLVTSRNHLADLVAAPGGRPVMLDLLSFDEARQLLARRLGDERVRAEPDAVEEIITRCARLPLALAVVAARAASQRHPLAELAAELRRTRGDLGPFTGEDPRTDVRAVFSWSYRALTPAAARLFRLLGLHPGPDLTLPAAASLVGRPVGETRSPLTELVQAHLLTEQVAGRYTFHDLLRAYAAEQAREAEPDEERRAAIDRVLDHYLHTAYAANRLTEPNRDPIELTAPRHGVTPEGFTDRRQAFDWFTAEHLALIGAIGQATAAGSDVHTWQLTWALANYLDRLGHWQSIIATHEAALIAARRLGDQPAQAYAHRFLARTYLRTGRYDDALGHFHQALDFYREVADQTGQAHTHHGIAQVYDRQGRHREALGHARQALDLYRATGNRAGQAGALNNIGWYHGQLGEHRQALACCEQALAVQQEVGDRTAEANTWDSLGYAHHHLGDHRRAIDCYSNALDLFRKLGSRYWEADTLTHLGDTHHATGETDSALACWRRALAILDDLEHADAGSLRAKLQRL
jgi:DNA-binding SARP family transcriptional activator/tetratricopeptide (TPR) repeat protein